MLRGWDVKKEIEGYAKNHFRTLTKPQRNNLIQYLQGLILPNDKKRKTIQAISEYTAPPKNQSSINRFLTKSPWDDRKFDENRARAEIPARQCHLVIDDTVIQKYGKKIEGSNYFWDNSEGHVVWGHCVVDSICVEDSGEIHPYKHQIYLKEEDAIKLNKEFKTKIQIAMGMVSDAKKEFELRNVIVDSWYLSNEFAEWTRQQGMHYFSELKINRKVWINGWISVRDLISSIEDNAFKKTVIKGEEKGIWSENLFVRGLDKVKVVIVKSDKDLKVIVTSALDLPVEKVVEISSLGWKIEEFHRDCKQNLGMEDCEMRKLEGVVRHLRLVYAAYSLIKWFMSRARGILAAILTTVGATCRAIKEMLYRKIMWWRTKTMRKNYNASMSS